MTLFGRPDLDSLTVGDLYRHSFTDEVIEYLGVAHTDGGEDVGIFRFADVDVGGCLIATQRSFNQGETFTPVCDVIADDIESDGDDPPTS
jgi:hypothetical protein